MDYGARFYDAVLGRWHSIDPIAEHYNWVTPFNYAENRPVDGIDLWGLQYISANATLNPRVKALTEANVQQKIKATNNAFSSIGRAEMTIGSGLGLKVGSKINLSASGPQATFTIKNDGDFSLQTSAAEANCDIWRGGAKISFAKSELSWNEDGNLNLESSYIQAEVGIDTKISKSITQDNLDTTSNVDLSSGEIGLGVNLGVVGGLVIINPLAVYETIKNAAETINEYRSTEKQIRTHPQEYLVPEEAKKNN